MAGQPVTAEPSHSARKERRSSPPFGSEKNGFVLSGAEDIRLSRRLAGLWPAGRRPCALRQTGGGREPGNFDGSAILDCVTANGIN